MISPFSCSPFAARIRESGLILISSSNSQLINSLFLYPAQLHTANAKEGLTVKAHQGNGPVLLGFNLEDHLTESEWQNRAVPEPRQLQDRVHLRHHRQGP